MASNNLDGVRLAALKNILTTEETCNILERSRQQLNNLIKGGDITVFKSTTNGNLFWRPDVYELLRKINRERPREIHAILGCSTDKSWEEYKELNLDKEEIDQIFVFFSHRDAILKNFYNIVEVEMPDSLTMVEAARFIIVMNDGTEYWFDGFTCGYSGQGCGGTENVLSDLGVLEKGKKNINPIISSSRMLHFWKDNNEWKHEGSASITEEHHIDSFSEENLLGIEECFYRYNGHLVLTQGARYKRVLGEVPEPSREVLFKSLYFVPNPVSVEFLSKEEALNTGHFENRYGETILYQVVIRDLSDRELWLNYPFDNLPEKKQHSMKELMDVLGVKVEEQTTSEKILSWLSQKPRNIYKEYRIEENN